MLQKSNHPYPDPAPHADLPSPFKGRVLVVDDELAVARLYARALGAEGFHVLSAADGAIAEVMFRRCNVDAVVSDVSMPGLDGISLLRTMHRIDPTVPVILATGSQSDDVARRAVEQGAMMCFFKPIDLRALTQAVGHAAQLHRTAAEKRDGATPSARSLPTADLTARFDRALDRLWIAYQPIVRYDTFFIMGYEALARSDEPTLATAGGLFGAAERLGRTEELGRALRAKVAMTLLDAPRTARIFVNLHGAELCDEALLDRSDPLRSWAGRIVLEITERESLEHLQQLTERIDRLRAAGFRIAVDDLGAGYAGLGSFAQLKPSVVKLDISLVRGVDRSPVKRRIVQAVAALCADTGVEIVAEGVETEEERATLGLDGCVMQQGYFYAQPQRGFTLAVR